MHAKTSDGQTAYAIAEEFGFLPIMMQLGRHATGFMGPVRPNRGRVDVSVRCPMGCGASLDTSEVCVCVQNILQTTQNLQKQALDPLSTMR